MGESPVDVLLLTMNRFIIFFCIGAVLSAVTEGSPRDVEFDFLETLMSDGHYPEHFFTEEAQVMPMQEHVDKKSMLLQKRDELKDDCDDAICETEGRAKRNILMNGKAIATKEKAFSKVLKFAKAAVAKALKATQALVLTEKLKVKITPKMMVRNAVYLKAFAVLNADKLDYSSKRLGILGTLLTLLMVKSKKSPVAQYADSIKMLAETNKKGLPRYMLRAIATSMMGDGVVSMGPVRHKVGQYVKISSKDVGFVHAIRLLDHLAASVNSFTETLQTLDKNAIAKLKNRFLPNPLSVKDFNRLFHATCYGAGKYYNFCYGLGDKATCDKHPFDTEKRSKCEWIGPWDGKLGADEAGAVAAWV